MGLFDKFKKAVSAEPAAPATPAAITAQASDFALCAPVSGKAVKMADVPDPVFSGEVLGKGCAIWPENDVVYAPVSGEVTVTMGHAVGLKSDSGVEVLVHVGVDTVDMKGRGFTGYVKQGDHVSAGDPMIKIDRSEIAAAGHPDCVVLAVSNTAEYASVTMTAEADAHVDAGAAVVEVAK
ncbi:PTS glucose transporter subunit IIA [Enorma massiliensis]|uniref:PTS sugar transporter subunit IIA n=1 Tax=Enorma massiliensis TaxID=1472761 RepID=UPI00082105AC|nr:PTS glucose transporter subunit IIA [Enorma massiliensis]MBM6892667.1 PTS glucose transporter subunit IIA [Enorma massiliensis]SCH96275.1 Glucose-specific phosphotransferase enzyme IIA component [uncultured Collinsella sp.]